MERTHTRYALEKVEDKAGQMLDTLVKFTLEDAPAAVEQREELTSVQDLDRLFDACSARWPVGWDLEKLLTCIKECEFD